MKRCVQTDIVVLVMELLTGEELRAIEAAKRLIVSADQVDPDLLVRVVVDPGYKPWSKRMAAYVLGFLPAAPDSPHPAALRNLVANRAGATRLRDFAAEALGNLNDEASATILSDRMADEQEPKRLRKSCIYALSQLHSPAAVEALEHFTSTKPHDPMTRWLTSLVDSASRSDLEH